MRLSFRLSVAVFVSCGALACTGGSAVPTAPSAAAPENNASSVAGQSLSTPSAAHPRFNLEAILRGEGFGLVKFRQDKDPTKNIVNLDVWVRDLSPNTSYELQRAVDTALDGVCTGTTWLTLGEGSDPQAIMTDDRGTGRAHLWRDLSAFAAGAAFDIYFRVVEAGTTTVVLHSGCYQFVVRD
jgi:hypothetical protein